LSPILCDNALADEYLLSVAEKFDFFKWADAVLIRSTFQLLQSGSSDEKFRQVGDLKFIRTNCASYLNILRTGGTMN